MTKFMLEELDNSSIFSISDSELSLAFRRVSTNR